MYISCAFPLLGYRHSIDSTEGRNFLALADEMLDKSRPAAYNQAIMDFGAIQCTPQSPNCMFCPLADSCTACIERAGYAASRVKQHRIRRLTVTSNYIYVRMGACTFIHKRTADDIWKICLSCHWLKQTGIYRKRSFCHQPVSFRSLMVEGRYRSTFGASECETCFVSSCDLC